ncbi:GNAT family N-acetyltransferase [Pontibacter sp. SGAir0037]|uniref:GNAT family N-acetyltransferase n=1 Tax=Pontibacter sp. SGAir0037 TaxID=2571030 RepID=UPI0010CD44EF|nr:GNAT family N-acetyltransferase [Pontibacter sp. SGAir0037]QCR21242.1 GNAT family N-acetyltransferase [Pontibacter sp. SGAir0037]
MASVRIVPCTLSDISLLKDIAIRSYKNHYIYLWYDGGEDYIEQSFGEDRLAEEHADPNAAFFLIYKEDELVGFLKLNIDQALEGYTAQESLELERIYLLKKASGRGIGSEVVAFTKEYARQRGKKVVWLKAMDSSHQALRFYIQNGFEICGTYHLEMPQMKEEYRGMYMMKLQI